VLAATVAQADAVVHKGRAGLDPARRAAAPSSRAEAARATVTRAARGGGHSAGRERPPGPGAARAKG
jgi:hypothetical protein